MLHNIVACFDKVILAKCCPKMSLPRSSRSSNAKSQNSSDEGVVETGAAVEQSQLLSSTGSRNSSSGSSQTSSSNHEIASPVATVSPKGQAVTGELEQFQSSGDSEPRADQIPVETGQSNVSVSGSGESDAVPGNTVQSIDQLNMSQLTGDAELSITGQTVSQRQAQAKGQSCPRWWGEGEPRTILSLCVNGKRAAVLCEPDDGTWACPECLTNYHKYSSLAQHLRRSHEVKSLCSAAGTAENCLGPLGRSVLIQGTVRMIPRVVPMNVSNVGYGTIDQSPSSFITSYVAWRETLVNNNWTVSTLLK